MRVRPHLPTVALGINFPTHDSLGTWQPLSHQVHRMFYQVAMKVPWAPGISGEPGGLVQWGHESFQAEGSPKLSSHSCREVDFVSTGPSRASEPPPVQHCSSGSGGGGRRPGHGPPAPSRARSVRCTCQPGLGGVSAALHLFQGSGFRGFFFFFLTTLQSRSPAPLPAAFEILWNKADTVL